MRPFLSCFVIIVSLWLAACSGTTANPGVSNSPTEAYKNLYSAVKSKNTDAIKSNVTKRTQDLALMVADRNKATIEKVYENGFSESTFSESLPEIRDERVKGNMGAVEVWNAKSRVWEDLPFILENGSWKLAVGDMFANTYESPGKGRAQKEREAANSANVGVADPNPNVNGLPANLDRRRDPNSKRSSGAR